MPFFFKRNNEQRTKKSFFSRYFRQRDVLIREQDKIVFCSLSGSRQGLLFLILFLISAWVLFTSVYFLRYNPMFFQKEAELKKVQAAFSDLQGEVFAFEEHLAKVIEEMDESQQVVRSLQQNLAQDSAVVRKTDPFAVPEKSTVTEQTGRLEEKTDQLKSEMVLVHERLASLLNGLALKSEEKDDLSFHKALLQRDIAAAEANALQEKVRRLEKMIAGMQETQMLVFRKMASVADGNIDSIEDDLSGIRLSLAGTGLGMDSLLGRIRRDKETVGIGGPYIPVPMSKPQHHLNISLVSLNQRLDHWYDLITLQNALPIGKPIDRIRVTSAFGARGDPFEGAPAHHEAVDLGGMIGEPVYTTAPGKVVRAGRWGWYGNMVEIDHGLGFRTRYAHMDKVLVTKGDTVRAGDRIGTVGNTGRSTGAHLHYEIRARGYAVDPMKFIKASKNVFKN